MRRCIPLLICLVAAGPLLALPDPSAEELDQNRTKLEQWRKLPEQMGRLRYNAQAFLALSPERRQQILQLDHDLHEESSPVQARLNNVWDKYLHWLEQLKKDPARQEDVKRILEAPDRAARLGVIRDVRELEWLRDQPQALREEITRLKDNARADRIGKVKEEDRKRAQEWLLASRFWAELTGKRELPCRLADLPGETQTYVNEYLKMMLLNREEKDRLEKAQGHWPLFPLTLVELADAHPPALPGPVGPRRFDELPRDVLACLQIPKKGKAKFLEGSWPKFGQSVVALAKKKVLPHELWPTGLQGLSPPMVDFVKIKLLAVLEGDDAKRLAQAEGSWPHYPVTIQELAHKYHLTPPWFTLPPHRNYWANYRLGKSLTVQGLPELPQHKLRDFVQFGLSDQERENLRLQPLNPAAWQRLHQVYFEKFPQELKSLRQRDQRKMPARSNPFLNLPREKLEKWDL